MWLVVRICLLPICDTSAASPHHTTSPRHNLIIASPGFSSGIPHLGVLISVLYLLPNSLGVFKDLSFIHLPPLCQEVDVAGLLAELLWTWLDWIQNESSWKFVLHWKCLSQRLSSPFSSVSFLYSVTNQTSCSLPQRQLTFSNMPSAVTSTSA